MPVLGGGDRGGEYDASRVGGLPDVPEMDAARDLLDHDGSEAFGPQLLVHAQEVDLGHGHDLAPDADPSRDAADEGDELLGGAHPDAHTNVPIPEVTRGTESPAQELQRVVEPEHVLVVFHVVGREQVVHLRRHAVVGDIARRPLVSGRQRVRTLLHLRERDRQVDGALPHRRIAQIPELPHRLRLPEPMTLPQRQRILHLPRQSVERNRG